ncbi:MAG: hypothetical protein U5N26_05350 [Candidatus Marinimicrobia bacterium]|nr:hypothetical protein [Candidatus Neomarinimicrobiota bacterium]
MATKARVIVGMSGGVDSSVAARLLQEQGYEVLGLTLRLADAFIRGGSKQSRVVERARAVCERLGIEHCVEDRTDAFDTCVVRYFADAYFEGRTPNPVCSADARVKWRALLEIADERDAGYVATGHYARISNVHGRFRLLKGRDSLKDQSYFLWRLNAKQLSRTLFPLGDFTKPAVRSLAKKWDLPSAGQSESQDICFIHDNDYKAFLGKYFPDRVVRTGPARLSQIRTERFSAGIRGITVLRSDSERGSALRWANRFTCARSTQRSTPCCSQMPPGWRIRDAGSKRQTGSECRGRIKAWTPK